jgi:hypothetical protein
MNKYLVLDLLALIWRGVLCIRKQNTDVAYYVPKYFLSACLLPTIFFYNMFGYVTSIMFNLSPVKLSLGK